MDTKPKRKMVTDPHFRQEKRKLMIKALKEVVVPEIKLLGFIGTFPHFRKEDGDKIYFISFQFGQGYSSTVGSFVTEFRKGKRSELPEWSRQLPFNKLNYGHVSLMKRLKLNGDVTNNLEHSWFRYSEFTQAGEYTRLAHLVKELLSQGVNFLRVEF